MAATAEIAAAQSPDAALVLGDSQYEVATLQNYLASYDLSWGRLKSITHPVPGNHEYFVPNAEGYFTYFGDAAGSEPTGYYSLTLGSWYVIALNSVCSAVGGCDSGSLQVEWLRSELDTNTSSCVLAFLHHPRYSSGKHGSSEELAVMWDMLANAGVDLVLSGHDHHFERFVPDRGMRQFVVGTGGKELYPIGDPLPNSAVRYNDALGILRLDLFADAYVWRFISEHGHTIDAGRDSCEPTWPLW